jgi:hypothetical protein
VRPAEQGLRARRNRWRGNRSALSQRRAPPSPIHRILRVAAAKVERSRPGQGKSSAPRCANASGDCSRRGGRQIETQGGDRVVAVDHARCTHHERRGEGASDARSFGRPCRSPCLAGAGQTRPPAWRVWPHKHWR